MVKAGELFTCACCDGKFPLDIAVQEIQLGPVCPECLELTRWAAAHLKKAKIVRPVSNDDINPTNKNRIFS
jgi:hypothetical protein